MKATKLLVWGILTLIGVFLILWLASILGRIFLIAVVAAAAVAIVVLFIQGIRSLGGARS